jgi:aspartate aminotransferase/aminotransferase
MFKPGGYEAKNIDGLILLNIWAHYLANNNPEKRKMIFAGLGKPSYILNQDIAIAEADYWNRYVAANQEVREFLSKDIDFSDQYCDDMIKKSTAIDYGLPAGEYESRARMATALSQWYAQPIDAENIIFSVGALAMLRMLFHIINEKNPDGHIITPVPFYPYYNLPEHNNNFHFVNVMDQPGYRLTAQALKKSIEQLNGKTINAFLFCDPSNPMGTVIGEDELKKIAEVLKTTSPDIPIILDEAYCEMVFSSKQHVSLLTVAPELKDRLVVLRSATKALSASGERMAVTVCFNDMLKEQLVNETAFTYLHTPKGLQYGYSHAMANFTPEKRNNLSRFYKMQVELATERLKKMHAQMPDPAYKIEGTFYVLADLSALLGTPFPADAQQVLGKKDTVTTDEDICYSLLFNDQVMISPLSYFGVDPHKGFVRITCSAGIAGINELMDRIEQRLSITK